MSELHDNVSIITAALATSAAPTYFHPTTHAGHAYINSSIGFNNPAGLTLKQFLTLYGPLAYVNMLISLGTGMIDMLCAFVHISTDAEGVHVCLEEHFAQMGTYFWFNPVGLEYVMLDDWTAIGRAVEALLEYLKLPEMQKQLAELAE